MTDDIVTRLRYIYSQKDVGVSINPETFVEAADEIERLRADLNNANAMANAYYELVQAYKWSHAHLGEWPNAVADLVAENYTLKKAASNGL